MSEGEGEIIDAHIIAGVKGEVDAGRREQMRDGLIDLASKSNRAE